jgi:YVTN family beta-propeller protein
MQAGRWALLASSLLLASCGAGAPAPDRIFVSQANSASVAVLDAATGAEQARIPVGLLPHDLVVSDDRRTVWVAVVGSQSVAEIDAATGTLRRTLRTASVPATRADGTTIQGHRDRDAFSHDTCFDCHDGGPGSPLPKYPGDRPFGMLLSPGGDRLLVAHLRSADLAEIDLATGRVARTVHLAPTGEAREPVALARLGDEIWVAMRPPQPSTAPGVVRRLDAATLSVLGETPTGADATALLSLPDRGRVLVSNFETDTVSEHDATGVVRTHAAAPGPLGLLALPGGRTVMALDYYSNALSLLDLDGGPDETLPLLLGGVRYVNPTHAALSSDGSRAWIVSSGTDGHLLEFDLAARRIVRDVPVDGLSFGVAVIPGSIR